MTGASGISPGPCPRRPARRSPAGRHLGEARHRLVKTSRMAKTSPAARARDQLGGLDAVPAQVEEAESSAPTLGPRVPRRIRRTAVRRPGSVPAARDAVAAPRSRGRQRFRSTLPWRSSGARRARHQAAGTMYSGSRAATRRDLQICTASSSCRRRQHGDRLRLLVARSLHHQTALAATATASHQGPRPTSPEFDAEAADLDLFVGAADVFRAAPSALQRARSPEPVHPASGRRTGQRRSVARGQAAACVPGAAATCCRRRQISPIDAERDPGAALVEHMARVSIHGCADRHGAVRRLVLRRSRSYLLRSNREGRS